MEDCRTTCWSCRSHLRDVGVQPRDDACSYVLLARFFASFSTSLTSPGLLSHLLPSEQSQSPMLKLPLLRQRTSTRPRRPLSPRLSSLPKESSSSSSEPVFGQSPSCRSKFTLSGSMCPRTSLRRQRQASSKGGRQVMTDPAISSSCTVERVED